MHAASEGHKEIVVKLIEKGADVFATDHYDQSTWKVAMNNKEREIARIIEISMHNRREPHYTFDENMIVEEIDEFPDF